MATFYTTESINNLINRYVEKGGEVTELIPGCLGFGLTLLHAPEEAKLKTIVIEEKFLNEWSSGNTVRKYNQMPKKYEKMLDDYYVKLDAEK